jgi:hypothetical protein
MIPISERDAMYLGDALLAFHECADIVRPYTMILDYFGSQS